MATLDEYVYGKGYKEGYEIGLRETLDNFYTYLLENDINVKKENFQNFADYVVEKAMDYLDESDEIHQHFMNSLSEEEKKYFESIEAW